MNAPGDSMTVALPPDLQVQLEAAAQDEHRPVADVLRELVEHGLRQRHLRAEILAKIDVAEASIARGEGIPITKASMRQLAEDVKKRGRARLAAERATPR